MEFREFREATVISSPPRDGKGGATGEILGSGTLWYRREKGGTDVVKRQRTPWPVWVYVLTG